MEDNLGRGHSRRDSGLGAATRKTKYIVSQLVIEAAPVISHHGAGARSKRAVRLEQLVRDAWRGDQKGAGFDAALPSLGAPNAPNPQGNPIALKAEDFGQ